MATVQKVNGLIKKNGLAKGSWTGSGRVRGWGHWHEGFTVQAEVTSRYQCRICYGWGNHKMDVPPEIRRRCSSGTWRTVNDKTGRVFVQWHHAVRSDQYDKAEQVATLAAAAQAAGFEVEATKGKVDCDLIISGGEA